jgi:hypothetical protein
MIHPEAALKRFSRLARCAQTIFPLLAICTLERASVLAQSTASYRDPKLGVAQRASDLLSRMALEEKMTQLQGTWQSRQFPQRWFSDSNRDSTPGGRTQGSCGVKND